MSTRSSHWATVALLAIGLVAAGCDGGSSDGGGASSAGGGTTTSAAGGSPSGGGNTGPSGGTGGSGGSSTTTSATGGGGTAGAGGGGPTGLPDVGTLVVLGDSIGDGGGVGPFYYQLLRDSLQAFYQKTIDYQNKAEGGSETDALVGQIDSLPNKLAGPVVVTITSGGNDMKAHPELIVAGQDGPLRQAMGDNIEAALDSLSKPNRFGAGVAVHVFEATIYDSSDGQGNFAQFKCAFSFPIALPTDGYFTNWNGEIAAHVVSNGQILVDMHGHFYGHGFNHPPSWYHTDCTHPNSTGHDQLRRLFHFHITGQELP